jgi:hypothetical protein
MILIASPDAGLPVASTRATQKSATIALVLRTAAGEYDLENTEQLTSLLVQMTRNKLASAARKQYRLRRDTRRTEVTDDVLQEIAAEEPTSSESLANQELLDALRRQLTSEERQIAGLRADGRSWDEVALALGGKAQARRMQLTRGVERAARELGLAELYE